MNLPTANVQRKEMCSHCFQAGLLRLKTSLHLMLTMPIHLGVSRKKVSLPFFNVRKLEVESRYLCEGLGDVVSRRPFGSQLHVKF
jgi:hypothetical protein